jgi:YD repeat-containing protein
MERLTDLPDALGQATTPTYDGNDNLTRFTDRKGQVSGFTYDALNRKVSRGFGATVANPTAYTDTLT